MTRIDTIEFNTTTDYIRDMDYSNFSINNISKPNGAELRVYSLNNKKLGINKIVVNDTYGTVRVGASAKVLGRNYNEGICLNTIEQFIEEVNSSGLVLDSGFIDECTISKSDIKNDLKFNVDANEYIDTLKSLIAPKFNKTSYKNGIVFNESIKSSPVRFTGYGKEYEIQKDKKSGLYQLHPELITNFDNTLRIESRLSKPLTIKKYFGSKNLLDVLQSSNINYTILNKIIDKQTKYNPIMNTSNLTNSEERNYTQIYYLNELYNGDFNRILSHITSKLSKNTKATYQKTLLKKYLAMINNADKNYSSEKIEEVKEMLLESNFNTLSATRDINARNVA